jgi:hypothetical protein
MIVSIFVAQSIVNELTSVKTADVNDLPGPTVPVTVTVADIYPSLKL